MKESDLEEEVRRQALDRVAASWGYENWRSFASDDLNHSGVGGSRATFDIVRTAISSVVPVMAELVNSNNYAHEQLIARNDEIDQLRVEVDRHVGRAALREAVGPHEPDECAMVDREMEDVHGQIAEVLNFLHQSGYQIHGGQRLIMSVMPAVSMMPMKVKESE